jgi:hypothetical protein
MAKYDGDKVELVKLGRAMRVRVEGSKEVKLYAKNAIVRVSGNDKGLCLQHGGEIVKGEKESKPVDTTQPPAGGDQSK